MLFNSKGFDENIKKHTTLHSQPSHRRPRVVQG